MRQSAAEPRDPGKVQRSGCKPVEPSGSKRVGSALDRSADHDMILSVLRGAAAPMTALLERLLVEKFLRGLVKLPSGCWTCETADFAHDHGYGRIAVERVGVGRIRRFLHRISYAHFKGPILKGLNVCHTCDNTWCCNPKHLFAGTQSDNLQDMVRKGRSRTGRRHHNARLSEDDVRAIRVDCETMVQTQVAKKYGICQATVSDIFRGKRWKHIGRGK